MELGLEIPGLADALALLARASGVGLVLAFLFETAPFISSWFQKLEPKAKWWIVFVFSLGIPLLAQIAIDFTPTHVVAYLEPYWKALAFGFLAWSTSQGSHIVFNKKLNGNQNPMLPPESGGMVSE